VRAQVILPRHADDAYRAVGIRKTSVGVLVTHWPDNAIAGAKIKVLFTEQADNLRDS